VNQETRVRFPTATQDRRGVAQPEARSPWEREVAGSSPAAPTIQPPCDEEGLVCGVDVDPPQPPDDPSYTAPAVGWLALVLLAVAIELWLLATHRRTLSQWMTWKARRLRWFRWAVIGATQFLLIHFFASC
jgi:hypothetical protein